MDSSYDVCVVGLGYIGLPTAAFLATSGHRVCGVDINSDFVKKVNSGQVPFFEPGFEALLKDVVRTGNLTASTVPVSADSYIIAVPTPFKAGYQLDDRFIKAAAKSIVPCLTPGNLIVLESTSPPLTTQFMAAVVREELAELGRTELFESLHFAHCPERVLPGRIMEEMATNPRVIGGLTSTATQKAVALYKSFCTGAILKTNDVTAEMAKLTENSFRDVNIAFANELSMICDQLNINVWELIKIANHHPRVNILHPGPGVGGHCIAVDPWFIVSSAPHSAKLIRTAREVNLAKEEFVCSSIGATMETHQGLPVAFLGLAFKPDIDDLRESPAVAIVGKICERFPDRQFYVLEPNIDSLPVALRELPNLTLVTSEPNHADLLVFKLVAHKEFQNNSKYAQFANFVSYCDETE